MKTLKELFKAALFLLAVAGGIVMTFKVAPEHGFIRPPTDAEMFASRKDRREFWNAATVKTNSPDPQTWIASTTKERGNLLWVVVKQVFWFFLGIVWAIMAGLRIAEIGIGLVVGLIAAALLTGYGWSTLRWIIQHPTVLISSGLVVAALLVADLRTTLLALAIVVLILGGAIAIAQRVIRAAQTTAITP